MIRIIGVLSVKLAPIYAGMTDVASKFELMEQQFELMNNKFKMLQVQQMSVGE
jgi:hypothetical protein